MSSCVSLPPLCHAVTGQGSSSAELVPEKPQHIVVIADNSDPQPCMAAVCEFAPQGTKVRRRISTGCQDVARGSRSKWISDVPRPLPY